MWFKLILLIFISLSFVVSGALWYKKSFYPEDSYDFEEDFKHSFLTPFWTYSNHHNDGKPRRIVPAVIILGGIGILVVGLIKIL